MRAQLSAQSVQYTLTRRQCTAYILQPTLCSRTRRACTRRHSILRGQRMLELKRETEAAAVNLSSSSSLFSLSLLFSSHSIRTCLPFSRPGHSRTPMSYQQHITTYTTSSNRSKTHSNNNAIMFARILNKILEIILMGIVSYIIISFLHQFAKLPLLFDPPVSLHSSPHTLHS
jgi:hypothetical protein